MSKSFLITHSEEPWVAIKKALPPGFKLDENLRTATKMTSMGNHSHQTEMETIHISIEELSTKKRITFS